MEPRPLNAPQVRQGGLPGKAPSGPPSQAGLALAQENGMAAASAPVRGPAADVAIDDWQDLLSAITARLRQTVGGPAAPPPMGPAAFLHIQAGVLDCAAALEQLQTTMAHELGRCRRLDQEMRSTQAALAQARADLACTRADEAQARHLAPHDSLTGLPSRSG
jgi:hypothetical protein